MSSPNDVRPAIPATPGPAGEGSRRSDARRGAWLLLGSFAAFVAAVATILLGDADSQDAQAAAADRLGVSVPQLPPEVLGPILADNPTPTGVSVAILALLSGATALFTAGVWILMGLAGPLRHPLAVGGIVAAAAGAPVFPVVTALESALAQDDPPGWLVRHWDVLYTAPIAAFIVLGCLATILLAARLRTAGLARRTGPVVSALAALSALAAFFTELPPFLPMLFAFVLGLAVRHGVRTRG